MHLPYRSDIDGLRAFAVSAVLICLTKISAVLAAISSVQVCFCRTSYCGVRLDILTMLLRPSHCCTCGRLVLKSSFTLFGPLSAGAWLAFHVSRQPQTHMQANLISAIALLLLLVAVFLIDSKKAFPGGWALMPVLLLSKLI